MLSTKYQELSGRYCNLLARYQALIEIMCLQDNALLHSGNDNQLCPWQNLDIESIPSSPVSTDSNHMSEVNLHPGLLGEIRALRLLLDQERNEKMKYKQLLNESKNEVKFGKTRVFDFSFK
ncbi:hypothetical protein GNI_024770 [Gregarina niphandrodes]|uniref:Uncharacterized protein n=1 Tax=Gregarina niphandrodes TaxID=110365 RepID=A0A023BBM0_GRENI|nr:hypothetical protein GNI_024770 [Gregarina niphandrodes]EZG79654.1 hypothetical protein GNI_024770 [Gregarina niphandrodes]|eukprot:XP_011134399.1 hypothetical protein GNI_024770 [Gregarina niphandrodes]